MAAPVEAGVYFVYFVPPPLTQQSATTHAAEVYFILNSHQSTQIPPLRGERQVSPDC